MWSCPPIWDRSAGFAARRSLWACANPDQPPRRPALGRKDGPPRYSAPDVSPADPCNKMARSCSTSTRLAVGEDSTGLWVFA